MAKKESDKKSVAELIRSELAINAASARRTRLTKVASFVLAIDDPFAEAVLRTYRSLTGRADLKLPCLLPCGEEDSTKAVKNYHLRSSGGGDRIRAQVALDWLKSQE